MAADVAADAKPNPTKTVAELQQASREQFRTARATTIEVGREAARLLNQAGIPLNSGYGVVRAAQRRRFRADIPEVTETIARGWWIWQWTDSGSSDRNASAVLQP